MCSFALYTKGILLSRYYGHKTGSVRVKNQIEYIIPISGSRKRYTSQSGLWGLGIIQLELGGKNATFGGVVRSEWFIDLSAVFSRSAVTYVKSSTE